MIIYGIMIRMRDLSDVKGVSFLKKFFSKGFI